MENESVAREVHLAHDVLTALVNVVRHWSSPSLEGSVASEAGVNIPDTEIRVIYLLGSRNGMLRPSDLAEQLGMSRSSLTKSLALLREQGLICGEATPGDRRAVSVTLTAAGKEAYEVLIRAGLDLVREASREFSSEDLEAVARFLCGFVAKLDGNPIDLPIRAR